MASQFIVARAMDTNLFWYSDKQWAKIIPYQPVNQIDPKRKDDRRFFERDHVNMNFMMLACSSLNLQLSFSTSLRLRFATSKNMLVSNALSATVVHRETSACVDRAGVKACAKAYGPSRLPRLQFLLTMTARAGGKAALRKRGC